MYTDNPWASVVTPTLIPPYPFNFNQLIRKSGLTDDLGSFLIDDSNSHWDLVWSLLQNLAYLILFSPSMGDHPSPTPTLPNMN